MAVARSSSDLAYRSGFGSSSLPAKTFNSRKLLVPLFVKWSAMFSLPGSQLNEILAELEISRRVAMATADLQSLMAPSDLMAS